MSDDYPTRCEGDCGGCLYLATGACPTCGISLCDECFNDHLGPEVLCPEDGWDGDEFEDDEAPSSAGGEGT